MTLTWDRSEILSIRRRVLTIGASGGLRTAAMVSFLLAPMSPKLSYVSPADARSEANVVIGGVISGSASL